MAGWGIGCEGVGQPEQHREHNAMCRQAGFVVQRQGPSAGMTPSLQAAVGGGSRQDPLHGAARTQRHMHAITTNDTRCIWRSLHDLVRHTRWKL